jgi:hypothetical protein
MVTMLPVGGMKSQFQSASTSIQTNWLLGSFGLPVKNRRLPLTQKIDHVQMDRQRDRERDEEMES